VFARVNIDADESRGKVRKTLLMGFNVRVDDMASLRVRKCHFVFRLSKGDINSKISSFNVNAKLL
jgi:hypothetical protein